MKYSSRLTSCEACRKLKRKCDIKLVKNGPCSNCKMRSVGHLCTFANDLVPPPPGLNIEKTVRPVGLYHLTRSGPPGITPPDSAAPSPVSIFTSLPATLLSSCAMHFLAAPELSFYLDQQELVKTVVELSGVADPNLASISLLYAVSAIVLYRRGAWITAAGNFDASPEEILKELTDTCDHILSNLPKASLQKARALFVRALYAAHIDDMASAFEYLDLTTECTQLLLRTPTESKAEVQRLNKLVVAIGYLQTTMCFYTNKPLIELLDLAGPIADDDFKLKRRWDVLAYLYRVQDATESTSFTLQELTLLEQEIMEYVGTIDSIEGRLLPYGQILLSVSLIKLRTYLLLRADNYNIALQTEEQQQNLASLEVHVETLVECLESVVKIWYTTNDGIVFMGSSLLMPVNVLQALVCTWILDTFTNRFQTPVRFADLRRRLFKALETLRRDIKRCKRTHILIDGLDLLARSQVEDLAKIPLELQSGIKHISTRWNSSVVQPEADLLYGFEDSSLWAYLASNTSFDESVISSMQSAQAFANLQ